MHIIKPIWLSHGGMLFRVVDTPCAILQHAAFVFACYVLADTDLAVQVRKRTSKSTVAMFRLTGIDLSPLLGVRNAGQHEYESVDNL